MLSLFSTLGGLLISGLPKLLDFFQNKADQKHELALARVQVELQLQMMAQGFANKPANWLMAVPAAPESKAKVGAPCGTKRAFLSLSMRDSNGMS